MPAPPFDPTDYWATRRWVREFVKASIPAVPELVGSFPPEKPTTDDGRGATIKAIWDFMDSHPVGRISISDVTGLSDALGAKVDAVPGKGLSTNDYTGADKAEIAKVKDKRDLSDRQWGERTFSEWTLHTTDFPDSALRFFSTVEELVESTWGGESDWQGVGWYVNLGTGPGISGYGPSDALIVGNGDAYFDRTETTDRLALDSEVDEKLAAKVDEFTEWVFSAGEEDVEPALVNARPTLTFDGARWHISGLSNGFAERVGTVGRADDVHTAILVWDEDGIAVGPIDATRRRVLRTGDALIPGLSDAGVPADPNVAELFSESNTSLTGVIATETSGKADASDLPIPRETKSAGFTTESYKRFIVAVSGAMTVTLHKPTGTDADVFECRFDGSGLSVDAEITFAKVSAFGTDDAITTMDTDCGTVKAGKVALMSAFWNGATWDVNWKVEG